MAAQQPRFGPGTTFRTRGKHPRECTVTDVLTTRNLSGEVVNIRYVATHQFLGQDIEDRDVCETTIAMGLLIAKPPQGNTRLQDALALLGYEKARQAHHRSNLIHALLMFSGVQGDTELEAACEVEIENIIAKAAADPGQ